MLLCLGSGDAFASDGRRSSAFFLKTDDKGILIDCGPTTLYALKKNKISTNDIDYIIISHFHGDHLAGVPFILLDACYYQEREKILTIIGPVGIEEKVKSLYTHLYSNLAKKISFTIKYIEITSEEKITFQNFEIMAIKTKHTDESLGYQITLTNTIIAYTGDTGWTNNLQKLLSGADLALVECNYYSKLLKTHLNYQQILELKNLVPRLIMIHLGDDVIQKLESNKLPQGIEISSDDQILID